MHSTMYNMVNYTPPSKVLTSSVARKEAVVCKGKKFQA